MAMPSSRSDFEPDIQSESNEAPVPSSLSALARFEFELGRGNEGTKILMVEWSDAEDDDDKKASNMGDWEVSWEGKTTVLSTKASDGRLHRMYFLLSPGTSIPKLVKLSQSKTKTKTIQVTPLPAIFPPSLGLAAATHGRKGVLHTIWAKKRLSVLQQEIELEMKKNGEGIALEMAIQEKQWIEENFGVGNRSVPDLQYTAPPTSPKSPGGGRLAEKLKGLKLGTSTSELTTPSIHEASAFGTQSNNPLSPDLGDVAVSSFSVFHGASQPTKAPHNNRIASLDAMTSGELPTQDENETGDELFAVMLSPRSPEMTKSPFSFSNSDTVPWLEHDKKQ